MSGLDWLSKSVWAQKYLFNKTQRIGLCWQIPLQNLFMDGKNEYKCKKKLQIFVNFCLKWQKTKTLVHTTMARPLCTMMDPSCRKSWDCSWFVYIQPNLEAGENNRLSPRILLIAGTYLLLIRYYLYYVVFISSLDFRC